MTFAWNRSWPRSWVAVLFELSLVSSRLHRDALVKTPKHHN